MYIVLILLLLMMFKSFTFHKDGLNKGYLSRDTTSSIKGIFVIIVFLSHIRTYVDFTGLGNDIVIYILNYLGQLMVAIFLFYSGYGVYESIKKKGNDYVNNFFKNRFLKTFFDFVLAVTLFLISSLIMGKFYSFDHILLSYLGWENLGNSNWYMFAIFTLYIGTYFIFKLLINKPRILSLFIMSFYSLLYVYVMSKLQANYWSSTYLCYIAGMWYSYFKEDIDKILFNNQKVFYLSFILIFISYVILYFDCNHSLMMFNLVSILFCLLIVLLSMKVSFNSFILRWFGNYLFWIYILQRIPMMLIKHIQLNEYTLLFLFLSSLITILLAIYINKLSNYIKNKIFV